MLLFTLPLSLSPDAEFDSRIKGLTGPVAAVRQMAQEYRVFFKKVEEDGDDNLVETSHNMYDPKLHLFLFLFLLFLDELE